jgi:glutaredoxin
MKFIIKLFFKSLRFVLIPAVLLWEKLTTPKGMLRTTEAQQEVDVISQNMLLYQFKTCPFCIKVRREITRLSLPIALRDAQKNAQHRAELLEGGGQIQVPCLKISDDLGNVKWMYESSEINLYLHQRFAAK